MIKIGFIDYYLDEWHANNYPEFFKTRSDGRYEVYCAYGKIDSPINGTTNKQWAEKNNIRLLDSIEDVIENSDRLIVLSPDNSEMHEELTDLALKSGKHVYVDKTFAPDKASALRIFENADRHNTKCYSCSALRFATELCDINLEAVDKIYSEGPGDFETYSIHQIEPVVKIMNSKAKRVVFIGDKKHPAMVIEFENGKTAQLVHRNDPDRSFRITTVDKENSAEHYLIKSDYFGRFIDGVIEFFDTGEVKVPHEQTIEVMGIMEAGRKAAENPFNWVNV